MNGRFVPPTSIHDGIQQNQMPQFPQQPSAQQPFYYPGHQQFPVAMVDPNIYAMVLMDILKNQGSMPWNGPPLGPGLQNGMHPGLFFPQGVNPAMSPMQHPQMYSQPPGLIPVTHDNSASPLSASDQIPASLSCRQSMDSKGKARATPYISRDSSGSSRTLASSSGKLFISVSGEPMSFYVAIEVHNRSLTLNHIKVCNDTSSFLSWLTTVLSDMAAEYPPR
jgi:hypothetical protein